jgi:hypothetical protein
MGIITSMTTTTQQPAVTESQMKRLQADWIRLSGEWMEVESIKGIHYGYGSELACLRLFHKYNSPKVRVGYNKNLNSWFFSLDSGL